MVVLNSQKLKRHIPSGIYVSPSYDDFRGIEHDGDGDGDGDGIFHL